MGTIFSSLSASRKSSRDLNAIYAAVGLRVNCSPGKPVVNPTISSWQQPPSPLAQHTSKTLPAEVDVLIIGSGITACSIAYHLLRRAAEGNPGKPPRIAILEARELCSGATGRNAGQIKEVPYLEWGTLVKRFGRAAADEIIRFRMAHLKHIMDVAEDEGLKDIAMAREVETVDVYGDLEAWQNAKEKLSSWLQAFPEEKEKWKVWEREEVGTKFALPTAHGAITGPAGAISPYNFATNLYSKLLAEFPTLTIDCNTPAETVQGTPLDPYRKPIHPLQPYSCFTFQGKSRVIRATHVVHANNGYVSRLLPGFKGKIVPIRGQMTTQRLFPENVSLPGGASRSWGFMWNKGFDYMTVQPDGKYFLGGGWARGENGGIDALANCRDDENAIQESEYLGGLLPEMFPDLVKSAKVEAAWTGIMGFSVDAVPWVGEVPEKVAGGRRQGTGKEWVCAGYSGEGMVNAWGCGRALASMLRNELYGEAATVAIPSAMQVTEKRVKKATVGMLVDDIM